MLRFLSNAPTVVGKRIDAVEPVIKAFPFSSGTIHRPIPGPIYVEYNKFVPLFDIFVIIASFCVDAVLNALGVVG